MSIERLARPLVVAIDGPAASGKGTLGRNLAKHFGMAHLDTGKLYRAVGYKLWLEIGVFPPTFSEKQEELAAEIAKSLKIEDTLLPELKTEDAGAFASRVSAIPDVRVALLEFQWNIAESPEGAVLDGRDIGTVVCPDADVKLFITASIQARAQRRYKELQNHGQEVIKAAILQDLQERDDRDKKREIAPLIPAKDAIIIDTTFMDASTVFEQAKAIIISSASR